MKVVGIQVRPNIAAHCECGEKIEPNAQRLFEISPHLRSAHGFSDAEIKFTTVSESICPRSIYVEAAQ